MKTKERAIHTCKINGFTAGAVYVDDLYDKQFVETAINSYAAMREALREAQACLQDDFGMEPGDMGIMTQISEALVLSK